MLPDWKGSYHFVTDQKVVYSSQKHVSEALVTIVHSSEINDFNFSFAYYSLDCSWQTIQTDTHLLGLDFDKK